MTDFQWKPLLRDSHAPGCDIWSRFTPAGRDAA